MSERIPAVVLGATGYVGGELLRLLSEHPVFEVAAAVSESSSGQPIVATYPNLAAAFAGRSFVGRDEWLERFDTGDRLALFSAAPHGASAALIAGVLEQAARRRLDVHVVDSSADFRYPTRAEYEAVYGGAHGAPDLIGEFMSGVPEHVAGTSKAHVGHPGCFATATLLLTVPLIAAGITDGDVFVSATTGSTGSGRSPQAGTHHPERHSNMYAYKPLAHRHAPEIAGLTKAATGRDVNVHFVPHSGPFARGIYATAQARASTAVTAGDLLGIYRDAYAGAAFVEVLSGAPRLKSVVASNRCQIGVAAGEGTIAVMSTLDNLVKGAAGGAVQWMNRLWGLPETAGLAAAAPGWT